jgi:glucan-binding YG repeat protein
LLPASTREFGPDGKLLDGIIEKDGTMYYYDKGKPYMAGLVCVDGDYYFAHGKNGQIATGKQYVWKTNDLVPEGNYEFDENGKMLNGFVTRDGEIYYYENGRYGKVGLNYIDGYYYFIDYGGRVIRNRSSYYVWETNGLSVEMNYRFDEYGRIVL